MKSKQQIYLNVMLFLIVQCQQIIYKKGSAKEAIKYLNTIKNLSFCLEIEIVIFLTPVI